MIRNQQSFPLDPRLRKELEAELKPPEFQDVVSDDKDSSDEQSKDDVYQRVVNNVYYALSESDFGKNVDEIIKKYLDNNDDNKIKSVDDLIAIVTPEARKFIPDSIKQALLRDICELLVKDVA